MVRRECSGKRRRRARGRAKAQQASQHTFVAVLEIVATGYGHGVAAELVLEDCRDGVAQAIEAAEHGC